MYSLSTVSSAGGAVTAAVGSAVAVGSLTVPQAHSESNIAAHSSALNHFFIELIHPLFSFS